MKKLVSILRNRARTHLFIVTEDGTRVSTVEADQKRPDQVQAMITDAEGRGYVIAWGASCIDRPQQP
jgi:hypothetical protein